jgi:hypothetical protein
MIILFFLPKWCTGILGLFVIGAILTFNFDRTKRVNIFKINFKQFILLFNPENERSSVISPNVTFTNWRHSHLAKLQKAVDCLVEIYYKHIRFREIS